MDDECGPKFGKKCYNVFPVLLFIITIEATALTYFCFLKAFLKHTSPNAEKRVTAIQDTSDVVGIPSLAAASSDTSPGDRTVETAKPVEPPKQSEEPNSSAVNSLLMAAMAMTEFQSQKSDASPGTQEKTNGVDTTAENLKPAARKGLRPSPKRKSSERGSPEGSLGDFAEKSDKKQDFQPQYTAISGEGDAGEYAEDDIPSSPLDPRELKRTRLGSVRKKMEWEKGGGKNSSPGASSKENNSTLHETPDQKTTLDILTPVSARCIDFRRMNVNEKKKESTLD